MYEWFYTVFFGGRWGNFNLAIWLTVALYGAAKTGF
jgi:hypothetical protein